MKKRSRFGNCHLLTHNGLTRFILPGFPLWHGFFARTGGLSSGPYASLNTAYITEDHRAPANRDLLFSTLGMDKQQVRILNPCHGDRIVFAENSDRELSSGNVLIRTDAAFTRTPETYFLFSVGDCIPAIFTDDSTSFVGLAHLGWRNLVAGFTAKLISALTDQYSIAPESLRVGIGPMIYPCCYLFRDPVQKNDPFWRPFLRETDDGRYAIDLVAAFRSRLIQCRVPDEKITEAGLCTACRTDLFFSCYKEGYVSGRFPIMAGHSKTNLTGGQLSGSASWTVQ